jgi:diketogulonate reductase-like aldo/keto reductase
VSLFDWWRRTHLGARANNILQDAYLLANGVRIPKVGLGTWQMQDGDEAYDAVSYALKTGYCHIDTAYDYENEPSVGRAVRESGIPRSQVFVTSKLPAACQSHAGTRASFNDTLDALGLDYLDLYLIHAPWPGEQIGEDFTNENREVWKAMEEIYQSGRCRAIGISSFEVPDIEAILENCAVKRITDAVRPSVPDRNGRSGSVQTC